MEIQNHKLATILAASIVLIINCCWNCIAQEEDAYYNLEIVNSGDHEKAKISGEIFFQEDSVKIYGGGFFINGDRSNIYMVDTVSGMIEFELDPGKYEFTCAAIYMKDLKAKKIQLKSGDSAKFQFYLAQSDAVIID